MDCLKFMAHFSREKSSPRTSGVLTDLESPSEGQPARSPRVSQSHFSQLLCWRELCLETFNFPQSICCHAGPSSPLIPRPNIRVTTTLWWCCPDPLRPFLTLNGILVGRWKTLELDRLIKNKECASSLNTLPGRFAFFGSPNSPCIILGLWLVSELNWIEMGRAHTVTIPICRWWN